MKRNVRLIHLDTGTAGHGADAATPEKADLAVRLGVAATTIVMKGRGAVDALHGRPACPSVEGVAILGARPSKGIEVNLVRLDASMKGSRLNLVGPITR